MENVEKNWLRKTVQCKKMSQLLSTHEGKRINIHLQKAGSDVMYDGVLERSDIDGFWFLNVERNIVPNHNTGQLGILPKCRITFNEEDVWYLCEYQETKEMAIEETKRTISEMKTLVTPAGIKFPGHVM